MPITSVVKMATNSAMLVSPLYLETAEFEDDGGGHEGDNGGLDGDVPFDGFDGFVLFAPCGPLFDGPPERAFGVGCDSFGEFDGDPAGELSPPCGFEGDPEEPWASPP